MSATLSMDLRERIVAEYLDGGGSYDVIGEQFGVSPSVIGKLVRQWRDEESLVPHTSRRGRRRAVRGDTEEALRQHVRDFPDATLKERRDALGLSCSLKTVWTSLQRLEARFKKNRRTLRSRTAGMSGGRAGTGSTARKRSIRNVWFSSTKPVSKRL